MFKEINGNVWDILDKDSTLYILTNDTLAVKIIYHEERENYTSTNINGENLDIDVEVVKN